MTPSFSALTSTEWLALAFLSCGKLLTISVVAWLGRRRPFSDRRVYALGPREGQIRLEYRAAWLMLTDPLVLGLLISSAWLRLVPGTFGTTLGTFTILFVWADLFMYFTHRLMHSVRWLWRVHAHHHRSHLTQPSSAISFSIGEKLVFYTLGWLLPLALVSHFVPISLGGVIAFYAFYFCTSPLAHANFELGAHPARFPLNLLGTASSHALHHARIRGNYGFLTAIPDHLFGTRCADSALVHERVIDGRPLNNLQERLSPVSEHHHA